MNHVKEEDFNVFRNVLYYAGLLRKIGTIEQKIANLEYQLALFQTPDKRKELERQLTAEQFMLKAMTTKKDKAKALVRSEDITTGV